MSWQTSEPARVKARVAERDIRVFKIVNGAALAETGGAYPYYRADDPLDRLTDANGGKTCLYRAGEEYFPSAFYANGGGDWAFMPRFGIHSYSPDCRIIPNQEDGYYTVRHGGAVNDEYYFRDTVREGFPRVPWVMRCVIPKGARYFLNEFGEYVSDRIRTVKFVSMGAAAG